MLKLIIGEESSSKNKTNKRNDEDIEKYKTKNSPPLHFIVLLYQEAHYKAPYFSGYK